MTAREIVDKMFNNDAFSQWLGISVDDVSAGESILSMTIREEMTNGFGIAHGGITFSFADSALAFASNARGDHAVSIETSISHTRPAQIGDVLFAEAIEKSHTRRFGIYEVLVTNSRGDLIALFKGTVYRTGKVWSL